MKMRFAIVNSERVEAKSGLKGLCPFCSQPVIAKCGEQRIHHWAHRSKEMCDHWWESETDWHRAWKSNFPIDWQEFILLDESTGEKHIADIRTTHGIVVEFQHSHITPQERIAREKFYKNMVWVVDGTRLQRDYPRFIKGKENWRPINEQGIFFVDFPEECFPRDWLTSSVPVIFDFRGMVAFIDKPQDVMRNTLWCLLWCQLQGRVGIHAILVAISREYFIDRMLNHSSLFPPPEPKPVSSVANNSTQSQPLRTNSARYSGRRGPLINYIEESPSKYQRTYKRKKKRTRSSR